MENAFEPASSDSVEGKIPEGVSLPNLDDPLVIKDLLRAHAMAVSKRLAEAVHKNVRREEVVQADQRAAAFLATTLLGQNPAYAKASVNTPERIEKLLRAEFTEALKGFGIKEEEAADPAVFMQIVMFCSQTKSTNSSMNCRKIRMISKQKVRRLSTLFLSLG